MKIFVARQPIFNIAQHVVAYELLFLSGNTVAYEALNGDEATVNVINGAFLSIGLDKLTDRKRAFINFTANLLKEEFVLQLPKQLAVIEIMETIEPNDEIIATCRKLQSAGYTLALDDFVFGSEYIPLLALVDIIKVDFLVTLGEERRAIMEKVGAPGVKFLAEKVETKADFLQAIELSQYYPVYQTSVDVTGETRSGAMDFVVDFAGNRRG